MGEVEAACERVTREKASLDKIEVIPRRLETFRRVQLKWIPSASGGTLVPAVWTPRFVGMWAAIFVVFGAFGATWGLLAARDGNTGIGIAGFGFCMFIWSVVFGANIYQVSATVEGGVVCEVDRQAGVVRLPLEGRTVPVSSVLRVRSISFSLDRNGQALGQAFSNQLQLVTGSGPVHVATHFLSRSAAERFARAMGVEFSECGAERQDRSTWEKAPAWRGRTSS